jgi:hypothetical protein
MSIQIDREFLVAIAFARPFENDPTLTVVGVGINADIARHVLRHRNHLTSAE